jgi:glutathione S-transferase
VPADRLQLAQVMQWMFWEQYSHEPYVAVVRAWLAFFGVPAGKEAEVGERTARGYAALDAMQAHLARAQWFGAERYSIADIALYAYTHVAPAGRFDLSRYPAIGGWLERVKSQPGHVPSTREALRRHTAELPFRRGARERA